MSRRKCFQCARLLFRCPGSLLSFRDDFFQVNDEGRKITLNRIPDTIKVNVKISVDKPVPHGDDFWPWNLRVGQPALLGHLRGGLPYDFNATDKGEGEHSVGIEGGTRLILNEGNRLFRSVQHVAQANQIILGHTALGRTPKPLVGNSGLAPPAFSDRLFCRGFATTQVPFRLNK